MIENTTAKKVSDVAVQKSTSASAKPQVQKISINGAVKGKIYESLTKAKINSANVADKLPAELQDEQEEELLLVNDSEQSAENIVVADASAAGAAVVSDAGAGAGAGAGSGVGAGAGAAAAVAGGMSPLVFAGGLLALGAAAGGGGGGGGGGAPGDTTPPGKPTLEFIDQDGGDDCDPFVVNNNVTAEGSITAPSFKVTLPDDVVVGDTIRLYSGDTLIYSYTLKSGEITETLGVKSYTIDSALVATITGSYVLTVVIVDASGNPSDPSDPITYLLDRSAEIDITSPPALIAGKGTPTILITGNVTGVNDTQEVTLEVYAYNSLTEECDLLDTYDSIGISNGVWSQEIDRSIFESLSDETDIKLVAKVEDEFCNPAEASDVLSYNPNSSLITITNTGAGVDGVLSPCDAESITIRGDILPVVDGIIFDGIEDLEDYEIQLQISGPGASSITTLTANNVDGIEFVRTGYFTWEFTVNLDVLSAELGGSENFSNSTIPGKELTYTLSLVYKGSNDELTLIDADPVVQKVDYDFLAPNDPVYFGAEDNTSNTYGTDRVGVLGQNYSDRDSTNDGTAPVLQWTNDEDLTLIVKLGADLKAGDTLILYKNDGTTKVLEVSLTDVMVAAGEVVIGPDSPDANKFLFANFDNSNVETWDLVYEALGITYTGGNIDQGPQEFDFKMLLEDAYCNESAMVEVTQQFLLDTLAPKAPILTTFNTYDPPNNQRNGDATVTVGGIYFPAVDLETESAVTPYITVENVILKDSAPNPIELDEEAGTWNITFRAKSTTEPDLYMIRAYSVDEAGNDSRTRDDEFSYTELAVILGTDGNGDKGELIDVTQLYDNWLDKPEGTLDAIVATFGGGDTVLGGNGNDRIYGGQQKDVLFGGAGDDYIFGGDSIDQFLSGSDSDQSDTLIGGAGSDTLVGGTGANDTFVFEIIDATGIDTITDFTVAKDKLVIANMVEGTIQAAFNPNVNFSLVTAALSDEQWDLIDIQLDAGDLDITTDDITVISYDGNEFVQLLGDYSTTLTRSDFSFIA